MELLGILTFIMFVIYRLSLKTGSKNISIVNTFAFVFFLLFLFGTFRSCYVKGYEDCYEDQKTHLTTQPYHTTEWESKENKNENE